ncbi:hypothetical protein ACHAXA_000319, partial [Cyclostephanos tholiformis]
RMGPNSKRNQQRAAEQRNVSARARFSKGPPPKKTANGGGGGRGDDGGRGGGGRGGRGGRGGGGRRNDDAVVRKIQLNQQRKREDLGGISVIRTSSTKDSRAAADAKISSISRRSRSALDGIDVSKLDVVTLSAESVAMVEGLLRSFNIWENEDENDDYDDEEEEEEEEGDECNGGDDAADTRTTLDRIVRSGVTMSQFAVDHGERTYDDYQGDYDDEPGYFHCRDDVVGVVDLDDGENSNEEEDDDDDDDCDAPLPNDARGDDRDGVRREKEEREALMNTPIFKHLTGHFSFLEGEAVQAMVASTRRLRVEKRRRRRRVEEAGEEEVDDKYDNDGRRATDNATTATTTENEGELLEMAMDWLSLHLEESDLRRGFRVRKTNHGGVDGRTRTMTTITANTTAPIREGGGHLPIRAVPHKLISVMPRLTQEQYEREIVESTMLARMRDLTTDSIRMGFHSKEVELAFSSVRSSGLVEEDGVHLSLDGELLRHIVACVESEIDECVSVGLDPEIEEMRNMSMIERDQEKDALEAIYAEGFQLLGNAKEGSDNLHFRIEVNPATPLIHPACSDKCHLHVMTRHGYPLIATPMLWFTNITLPPTLLRRISINLMKKAKELMGRAAVFDLVEYLSEGLAGWQKQFIDEEALAEKASEDNERGGVESDDDEIDYYAHFTEEERKKLSRRQRQKLRAAEKAHSRDAILLQKQRLKEIKEEERRKRVRFENETIATRMAEKAVNKRWKEWVEEEAEKAARKAMNDAFLRGEERDSARDAAEIARKEMLLYHGELEEEVKDEKIKKTVSLKGTAEEDSVVKDDGVPKSIEMTDDAIVNTDDSALQPHIVNSDATPKTLLFVEKLRRMYDEKAKEKATGIHLLGATSNVATDVNETVHLPTPMVAPSPGIEDVLRDVLTTQREQPWLISPEARVPTTDDNFSEKGTSIDESRKIETSKLLRIELERKYSQAEKCSMGNGRHRNNRHTGDSAKQFQLMLDQRSKLPAFKMRDKLISTIHQNQVTVVSGDTGCGKTTQVPQLILDDLIMNNRGAEANIIVTQPRRISAIGVSERIAAERCEKIGQSVGYSIRLESKRSNKTRLLLCTTGILLRRLQCDPDLASVSHVFVDEVHERDLNTDFLLIILKDLLRRRKSLKLILMSATLNADRFSSYFGGCPEVSIPGRAQPVKEYRLEDALQVTDHKVTERSECAKKTSSKGDDDRLSKSALKKMYPMYNQNVIDSLAVVDESITNYELVAELLQYICTNLEEGAILVFLSGMKEITTAIEALTKIPYFQDSSNVVIYPLHSSLSSAEQTAIFQRPPSGKRKIVLSTNIAETSITIDDVVFVVDSGRVKENRYDDLNKMPTLIECWASKASAKQRRGRAGRVKPGYCWHLFSTHTYDKVLDDYQLPEIMRVGLEDLVLQILVLDLGEPNQFLGKAVDPPTELSIKNALQLLESLGAAECNWDLTAAKSESTGLVVSTSLTALGYHLASLPVHPRVGKLLIYGALFGVFDESSTIAAAMTSRSPFISSFDNRDAADEAKRGFASDDHISILYAFNQWRELRQKDGRQAKAFLREHFLSYIALSNIMQLKKQLEKYMADIGFRSSSQRAEHNGYNKSECEDLHLVRAVIAAGLYPNIVIAPKSFSGKTAGEVAFRGQKINEVYLHPSTIAFKAKELASRYGCYHDIMKTSKVYIRDLTAVSKFTILLFGGDLKVYQTHGVVAVDEWLKFRVSAKPATLIKHLRAQLEALLLEKIMDPSIDISESQKGRAVIASVSSLLKFESAK